MAFALNTLVSKIAVAVTGFAAASFLAFGHYAPGATAGSPALAFWLKAGFLGLPAAAIAIQLLLMLASREDNTQDIPIAPPLHG